MFRKNTIFFVLLAILFLYFCYKYFFAGGNFEDLKFIFVTILAFYLLVIFSFVDSKRVAGILIILGVATAIFVAYNYYFVTNLVSLESNSNKSDYEIKLNSSLNEKHKKCLEQKCIISGLSPIKYSLTATKEGYENVNIDIDLTQKQYTNIVFQRKITLEKLKSENKSSEKIKKTRKEIIEELKKQRAYYKIVKLDDFEEFSFKQKKSKLELYFGEKLLGVFDLVGKEDIAIDRVYMSGSYIFLKLADKKYIINTKSISQSYTIDLQQEIEYVKYNEDMQVFQLVSENRTYLYDNKNGELKYFELFSDFVSADFGYIGIIKSDETQKKKTLGFEKESGDLLVYFDKKTNQKFIIDISNIVISRIFKEKNKIVLFDKKKEKYFLNLHQKNR